MSTRDVAAAGRAALFDRLRDIVVEAREASGRASAVDVVTVTGRLVHIKVSTRTSGTWQSTKSLSDSSVQRDPNRLWAFVSLGEQGPVSAADVALCYEADVRRDIYDDVERWFARNGLTDPALKARGHAAISVERVGRMARPIDELLY